jgi:DNA gyrase subunit A
MLALRDGRPEQMPLKDIMEAFLRHREQVIRRRTEYLLREAKKRSHVLEGQLIAISSLDEVIRIVRGSPSRASAKERLQQMEVAAAIMEHALEAANFAALQREIGVHATYRMTEAQAEAVVRLQLGQLAALERNEILKEFKDLREKIRGYEQLLSETRNIRAVIRKDLEELRDKYGDDRRTEIHEARGDISYKDLIVDEPNIITISHKGYIKRLPLATYRSQHRGGKGVSGGNTRDDDFVEHFFVASTKAYLLCFTNRGQVYWLEVYQIPELGRTSPGRALANVLSLKNPEEEKITSVIPVRQFDADHHLTMATRRGLVKKTALEKYSRPRQGGIIGIALEDGDTLIDVALTQPGDEIVLCTRHGMAIRFDQAQVREVGRDSKGVKGINLGKEDEVVGMTVADPEGYLLTVCEKGYGKRTPFGANVSAEVTEEEAEEAAEETAEPASETSGEEATGEPRDRSSMRYRKQRRGGKGLRDIRTDRNGPVVAIASVRNGDEIMLITTQGMVNRTGVNEIRVVGRNTQGVRIMNLNDADKIASVAKVAREEVQQEATTETPQTETEATEQTES